MEDAEDSKRKRQIFWYGKDDIGRDASWLYPTLSELIEACESDFYELQNLTFGWIATADSEHIKRGDGETPEQAVAKLWLALHPKA